METWVKSIHLVSGSFEHSSNFVGFDDNIVVVINMFRFKRGNCLSVIKIVKKELK